MLAAALRWSYPCSPPLLLSPEREDVFSFYFYSVLTKVLWHPQEKLHPACLLGGHVSFVSLKS